LVPPLLIPNNRKLFEAEEQDLFRDIQSLLIASGFLDEKILRGAGDAAHWYST
jgi:hypothetical protein